MPVSAYLKAGSFVVAAATAMFAAAGTVAIPSFWAYLAILAAVMIVSFAVLDPDLLRERMRPGGKKPPFSLRIFSLVLFMALDRCRARPWPFPLEPLLFCAGLDQAGPAHGNDIRPDRYDAVASPIAG